MIRQFTTLAVLFILPTLAVGGIYKHVTPDGNVIYSDQPSDNATEIHIPETQTFQGGEVENPYAKEKPPEKKLSAYHLFSITEPKNDAYFTRDIETVGVQIGLAPPLQNEDKIQLYLNGDPVGEPAASTEFLLPRLDRGEYELTAKIVDMNGRPYKAYVTKPIKFYQNRGRAK